MICDSCLWIRKVILCNFRNIFEWIGRFSRRFCGEGGDRAPTSRLKISSLWCLLKRQEWLPIVMNAAFDAKQQCYGLWATENAIRTTERFCYFCKRRLLESTCFENYRCHKRDGCPFDKKMSWVLNSRDGRNLRYRKNKRDVTLIRDPRVHCWQRGADTPWKLKDSSIKFIVSNTLF